MLLVKALFYCCWVDKPHFFYVAFGLAVSVWHFHSLWFYCFSFTIPFFHTILELKPFCFQNVNKAENKISCYWVKLPYVSEQWVLPWDWVLFYTLHRLKCIYSFKFVNFNECYTFLLETFKSGRNVLKKLSNVLIESTVIVLKHIYWVDSLYCYKTFLSKHSMV